MMISWYDFKYEKLQIKRKKRGKRGSIDYYEPLFYDSETSKTTHFETRGKKTIEIVDETHVYLWACGVGKNVYYGRYLHEFIEFIKQLIDIYNISPDRKIDIYVHNLSYDISYMYDLLFENFNDFKPLYTAPHKIICWEIDESIILKCSFRLVNKSLDKWSKDLNIEHKKKTGTKDYQAYYKPYDPLPANELEYMEYDILSLKECYYAELKLRGYDFTNVPLTVTGFVRKEFQKNFLQKDRYWDNKKTFYRTVLNDEQYNRLIRASAGGMTAANIVYIGRKVTCENGIGHGDFDSHYPTQQKINPYPMHPETIYDHSINGIGKWTFKRLDWLQKKKSCYYVVDIELKNIRIKEGVTMPYINKSKLITSPDADVVACNGKVISITGVVRYCCTNLDLDIIRRQYKIVFYSILCIDTYTAEMLPNYILDTVNKYYKSKTDLKDKHEHLKQIKAPSEDIEDARQNLMISKGMLNGIFGCMFTRPVRKDINIDTNFVFSYEQTQTLEGYYEKQTSCLAYQWGVFTTAFARSELYYVIEYVIGYKYCLYCDTDSVFFIPTDDNLKAIEEYNKKCFEDSKARGLFIRKADGTKKYYHKFDFEKDSQKSKTFKALHAKCYALEPDGELEITVAGVARKTNGVTREQELGSIDNLSAEFTFKINGGTRADYSTIGKYDYTTGSGGGCAILETEKTLHETFFDDEYGFLLEQED